MQKNWCSYCDRDIIKSSLLDFDLTREVVDKMSYQLTFDLAKYYLSMGNNVIIDTPCYYEEILKKGQALSNKYNANYKFIECQVNDFKIIKNRILNRENMASQIKNPTIEEFKKANESVQRPEKLKYIIVDTTDFNIIDFNEIEKYLKELSQIIHFSIFKGD